MTDTLWPDEESPPRFDTVFEDALNPSREQTLDEALAEMLELLPKVVGRLPPEHWVPAASLVVWGAGFDFDERTRLREHVKAALGVESVAPVTPQLAERILAHWSECPTCQTASRAAAAALRVSRKGQSCL